jgi:hypothetical protein
VRTFVLSALLILAGCGGHDDPPDTSPPLEVDRSTAEAPEGLVVEIALDGGDAALAALAAPLPPGTARTALPTRVSVLLEGLIDVPPEIVSRVSETSPIRIVMARIDDEMRSAVAVRLSEPVPASARAPGGPRGADRVGTSAAVDDRIAVVTDDPAMLDRAFGYLAYVALDREETEGVVVARVPASTLATTVRNGLAEAVVGQRASVLASIAAARAAHDRPPDLGDPEALVTVLAEAALARLGYLPDLGDATVRLSATPSGLALAMEATVTAGSPLATALAGRTHVGGDLAAAMPAEAALVVATGTTASLRAASGGELADVLASVGGARVSAGERASLDEASRAIAALRGDEGAVALGATDANGLFGLGLTRPGSDAPAPTPWGRTMPWTSGLLGALAGCTPSGPRRTTAGAVLCGDVALATGITGDVRSDALARGAAALGDAARAAASQHAAAPSPDLARDLAGMPEASFAIALVRPLRVLPVLAALGGPPPSALPRGDGALVIALAHDQGVLHVDARASTAALADFDVLRRLFADAPDSE